MTKDSYPRVFDRLDQAYSYWEEEMWKIQLRQHFARLRNEEVSIVETGYPVEGFEKTRSMLLEAATRDDLSYLLPNFRRQGITKKPELGKERMDAEIASGNISDEFCAVARWEQFHFPHRLGQWNATARRIYHLPEDLVLMLQATSLRGRTFADLRFPFPSFGLALEHPILTGKGEEIDFILICGDQAPESWYAFSKRLSSWKPTDPTLRNKINRARASGNHTRFKHLAYKPVTKADRFAEMLVGYDWLGASESNWDVDIEADLQNASRMAGRDEDMDWTDKFFRVVIGFAFYLQAFQESQKDLVTRIPAENQPIRRAPSLGTSLISPEEIFKVQSIFSLSREERTGLSNFFAGRGGWEVNTHFREGYWRRPAGEGNNPLAQKTIWARPTMVRRDRLAENSLPMGAGVHA
ncbi:MAG: hypothetical protein JWL75_13 [Parcubacteria group bacterium]|nr:hypothetical protein [Parcubacteria group bacterium]